MYVSQVLLREGNLPLWVWACSDMFPMCTLTWPGKCSAALTHYDKNKRRIKQAEPPDNDQSTLSTALWKKSPCTAQQWFKTVAGHLYSFADE